nr:receptor-like protein kinase FERONIA [Aegilops tauschii subsp. strangulata]
MGAAAAAICCVAMAAYLYVHERNKKKRKGELNNGEWLPEYRSPATGGGGGRSFSFAEIKAATRNFSEAQVVGVGRRGKVFRGVVDGGTAVAIKLAADPSPGRSAREFRAEIEALPDLRHRHLVPILGFCSDRDETILVYRYMPRGTLREHLRGKNGKPAMPWWRRLDACMGAARGLHCLHAGGVVHGDVKATTVLLDENWVAKLSDFGLSNSKHVTMKSDVYSFGVVLFEALMARRPALLTGDQAVSLAEHALACHRNGTLPDAVDAAIKDQVAPECLEKFAETAVECLAHQVTERPAMGDVLWNLELSMQLQLINPKRT